MKKRITRIVFSVLIMVALYVLYCFNYIPHKRYTNADFNIEAYKSNIDITKGRISPSPQVYAQWQAEQIAKAQERAEKRRRADQDAAQRGGST